MGNVAGVGSFAVRQEGRFVVQSFQRRTTPMYRTLTNVSTPILYTDFVPIFALDTPSWSDFQSAQGIAEGLGLTLRQYVAGSYALRLDTLVWPVGTTFPVGPRGSLTQAFRPGFQGTYSFGIWGCKSSSDKIVVEVLGKKLWEENESKSTYEIQANELGLNVAPAGGIVPAGTLADFESNWMMNAGTAGAPSPRGWYGRWGSTLSDDPWLYIRSVKLLFKSVDLSGTSHGFGRHPFDKSFFPDAGEIDNAPLTASTYSPEFFIHQHEPVFATPWPDAKRKQLVAIRMIPGGSAVSAGTFEFANDPAYLIWADSFARPVGASEGDYLGTGNANPWIGENTAEGRTDSAATGSIWGISNIDDGNSPPLGSLVGDAPRMDVGTTVEAYWDRSL